MNPHLNAVDLRVGEGGCKKCAGDGCGDSFFVCASGGCGEDVGGGRGGLGQLKRIWAGWALKWQSPTCYSFFLFLF
jgi:hypothetical protein